MKSTAGKLGKSLAAYLTVCVAMIFLTTCKKEVTQNSNSDLRFLNGGTQDIVLNVIRTRDEGFLYMGYSTKGSNTDAFLLKIDAEGKQQWYKTYGGYGFEYFRDAVSLPDGSFLIVGVSNTESFDSASAESMGYALRIDANGTAMWERKYGNAATVFSGVIENPSTGGFLICGSTVSGSNITKLISIDGEGKLLFDRQYNSSSFGSVPPLYNKTLWHMYTTSITLTGDASGSILLGGTSSLSYFLSGNQTTVPHIIQTGSTGLPIKNFYRNTTFQRNSLGFYSYNRTHFVKKFPYFKILKLNDGYLIGTTNIDTANYGNCIQLFKTDFSANIGQAIWHKEIHGLSNTILNDIYDNGDGTFLLTGTTTSEYENEVFPESYKGLKTILIKVDNSGNKLWEQIEKSEEDAWVGMSTSRRKDDGYTMAGYCSITSTGYHKMFYKKLDKEGNLIKNQ